MAKDGGRPNGLKADDGKLRYDLIPLIVEQQLAAVLTFGALKYADNTWQGVESERYYAALRRHLNAWGQGEPLDPETGLHHLTHALACVSFLLWQNREDVPDPSDPAVREKWAKFSIDGDILQLDVVTCIHCHECTGHVNARCGRCGRLIGS